MCGIAGFFGYRHSAPRVDVDALVAVRDHMARRGPDSSGLWVSPERDVGLAHRRLSIIDLSEAGNQPFLTADGRYSIVFNGEIYNYQEIRELLLTKGYQLHSTSDTEVIPFLFNLEGPDMFHRLRGMYAFALWDNWAGTLLLARDPLGIKPLYYADDGKSLWFASQVRALLAGGIDRSPDPAGHVGFHLWGHVPEPFTLFKNIHSLPAGHFLLARRGETPEVRKFWSIHSTLAQLGPDVFAAGHRNGDLASSHAAVKSRESMREIMRQTVTYHMVADVPVGIFLSAGRDSSTLVALATEDARSSVNTITIGFEDFRNTDKDEAPLAALVAAQYGTRHSTSAYGTHDMALMLEPFLKAMDQPTVDGFNVFLVSHAARQQGLKVALSGVGADEIFGGYSSFDSIPKLVNRTRLVSWVPGFGNAFRVLSAPIVKSFANPKYASIFELGSSLGGAYLLRRGMFMPWELPGILDPDLVREGLQRLQPLTALNTNFCEDNGHRHPRFRLISLEIENYLRNQLLRDTDWASMYNSLEVRTPFVDAHLLENIVVHANRYGWPSKSLMAGSPKVPLPAVLLNKPKTGFSIPRFDPRRAKPVQGEPEQRTWAREVFLTYGLANG